MKPDEQTALQHTLMANLLRHGHTVTGGVWYENDHGGKNFACQTQNVASSLAMQVMAPSKAPPTKRAAYCSNLTPIFSVRVE